MKKLSIPTGKLSKILPVLGLVLGGSSDAISQKAGLDTIHALDLGIWWHNPTLDTTLERKSLDSIFHELHPCIEEFYAPGTHQPENVAQLCRQTQESLNNVFMIRVEMRDAGYCRGRIIAINQGITDRVFMQNTLIHELFHLNRREELEQNITAYNKLPTDQMLQSYFVKSASLQAKKRKANAGEFFDASNDWGPSIPLCDGTDDDRTENENRDNFISYIHEEVDKVNWEKYERSANHPSFVKQIAKDAITFGIYITLPEELYARARNLQTFLLRFYGIPKEEITEKDIRILADDIRFDEKEFIMLLDGFETEFLEYLNTIEPK